MRPADPAELGRRPERLVDGGGLGLGCSGFGRLTDVSEQEAYATVHAALAGGINLFDTAPHYGAGISERRLGDALRGVPREAYVLSTKIGRAIEPQPCAGEAYAALNGRCTVHDYGYDGAWRSLEGSLRRLGVDHVDVLHAHDPMEVGPALDGLFKALTQMREQGVVRAIGCGMNTPDLLSTYLQEVPLDVVMIAGHLNLLDQDAAAELLPLARDRGVDVWVAGVYATGVLAGSAPTSTYRYAPAGETVLARVRAIEAVCREHGIDLTAAALAFPWRHDAVSRVIVGARRAGEVLAAIEGMRAKIPEQLWADLQGGDLVPMGAQ